jgi:hypothetical protein
VTFYQAGPSGCAENDEGRPLLASAIIRDLILRLVIPAKAGIHLDLALKQENGFPLSRE